MDFLANDAQPPRGGAVDQPGWLSETGPRDRRPPAQLESGFDAARRLWRVALAWVGVAIVALLGLAFCWGVLRSAHTGLPMADFSSGVMPLLALLAPLVLEQINRHNERKAGVA